MEENKSSMKSDKSRESSQQSKEALCKMFKENYELKLFKLANHAHNKSTNFSQ